MKPEGTTLFYASDIHGSDRCFRKFINAAKFYEVDVLILGGDITGKALIPIVREAAGRVTAEFLGKLIELPDEAAVVKMERQIAFNGFYAYRCDVDELKQLQEYPELRARAFEHAMRASVAQWLELASDRLRGTRYRCLVMAGNDDPPFVAAMLRDAEVIEAVEGVHAEVGGMPLVSVGFSNPTPWDTPRELPEEDLGRMFERLLEGVDATQPWILNAHVPPFNSSIDSAPELTSDLGLKGGASARMVPVGSTAVRRIVETYRPILGLHGHIHESAGAVRIGPTTCVNPGSDYNAGVLRGVVVRLDGGRVARTQFVSA